MKPVAVLVNDLHISNTTSQLVLDIWYQVIEFCLEDRLSNIIIGGDVFEARSGQSLTSLNTFDVMLGIASDNNIKVHAIAGNHDKTSQKDDSSYLDIFHFDNFINYREPDVFHIDGTVFGMLPFYIYDVYEENLAKISKQCTPKESILITHNDMLKYYDVVAAWKTVFVGHLHNREEINNIVYTGSIYQKNYGEDIEKGFTLIYDNGQYQHIATEFPMYIKREINSVDLPNLQKIVDEVDRRHFNRFIFNVTKEEYLKLDKKMLKGIETKLNPIDEVKHGEYSYKIYDKDSILSELQAYIIEKNIPADVRDVLVNTFKEN